MRRLLLVPALALVLLGTPVLALQVPTPPGAAVQDVPLASEQAVDPGLAVAGDARRPSLVGITWQGDPAASFTVEARGRRRDVVEPRPARRERRRAGRRDPGCGARGRGGIDGRARTEPVWIGDDVDRGAGHGRRRHRDRRQRRGGRPRQRRDDARGRGRRTRRCRRTARRNRPLALRRRALALAALLVALALGLVDRRASARAQVARDARARRAPPGRVRSGGPGAAGPEPVQQEQRWWQHQRRRRHAAEAEHRQSRAVGRAGVRPAATRSTRPSVKFAVVHHTVNSNTYARRDTPACARASRRTTWTPSATATSPTTSSSTNTAQIYEGRAGGIDKPGHRRAHRRLQHAVDRGRPHRRLHAVRNRPGPVERAREPARVAAERPPRRSVEAASRTTAQSSPCGCVRWADGTIVTFPTRSWPPRPRLHELPGRRVLPPDGPSSGARCRPDELGRPRRRRHAAGDHHDHEAAA